MLTVTVNTVYSRMEEIRLMQSQSADLFSDSFDYLRTFAEICGKANEV